MKMLSTLTWIWKTFLSAEKDCYISFPTWVWRRVRPRIQRICPDLTSRNLETLVLWQMTTNQFRGILKIKQLPANHWVVGVMTGMVGVAGKEKDENESSTFFFNLACSRVFEKDENGPFPFFSSWPALESLQAVLTWVQGRPDEGRVALEDVFPPWSKNQIRQVNCLAFFMRVQKSRFRQFARCNLF